MSNNIDGSFVSYVPNTLDNESAMDTALGNYLLLDGSSAMQGSLNMNAHRIINLNPPVNILDACNKSYTDTLVSNYLPINGSSSMRGSLNMSSIFRITNVSTCVDPTDVANKQYVDDHVVSTVSSFVTLSTAQTITGQKTFSNQTVVMENTLNGISTGWSLTSPSTLQLGTFERNGCVQMRGSFGNGLIQMTTINMHLDTTYNSNGGGVFVNNYSPESNSYLNNASGTGCVLLGTSTWENLFKASIHRQSKMNALLVTGNAFISSGLLSMGGNKISSLANGTDLSDAVNMSQFSTLSSNVVTLTGYQIITGPKSFEFGNTNFNRLTRSTNNALSFSVTGSVEWELGSYSTSFDLAFKKNGLTPLLTINYASSHTSMNGNQLRDVGAPTLPNDAMTLGTADLMYVTLSTNQNISGIKTFGQSASLSYMSLNRLLTTAYTFFRYSDSGAGMWDVGVNPLLQGNSMYWYNFTTAVSVMTLLSTGSLGIGTTSPAQRLHIESGDILINRPSTDGVGAVLTISSNTTVNIGATLSLESLGTRSAGIKLNSNASNKKMFFGRPYSSGSNTESRLVIGYVSSVSQSDPAIEVGTLGGRNYVPTVSIEASNGSVGINTISSSVIGLEVTGNVKNTQPAQTSPVLSQSIQLFNGVNIATTTYATLADMQRELEVGDVLVVGGVQYTVSNFPLGTTITITPTPTLNLGPVAFYKLLPSCTPVVTEPSILKKEPSKTTIENLYVSNLLSCPQKTTAVRDTLVPQAGSVVWNTTLSKLQVWVGGSWIDLH